MKLIARKPCSFRGKKFSIGEEIPAEYVLNPKLQEKQGVLAISVGQDTTPPDESEKTTAPAALEVVIRAEEGDLPLTVTAESLQAIVDVVTGTVDEGKTIVEKMEDGDALILLHNMDSRKGIQGAAEERAKALNEAKESEGEQ